MNFDVNKVVADMLSAIKGTVEGNWKKVESTAKQFMQNRKESLELLIQLRLDGDIDQDEFDSRIEDEKLVIEAELNALEVLSKAIAQNAANAAIDILGKAVKAAISAAI
jgi:hypothetical protein